jgi:hypothetical protein
VGSPTGVVLYFLRMGEAVCLTGRHRADDKKRATTRCDKRKKGPFSFGKKREKC